MRISSSQFLASLLLFFGTSSVSCGRRVPIPTESSHLSSEHLASIPEERRLPTKAEWLIQVSSQMDVKIDFVEAVTVLANEKSGVEHRYSTIHRSLSPHIELAKRRLSPSPTAVEKIDVLNDEVLPAI